MWEPMATAPPDRIVRLAIIDKSGAIYALPHPCRRARDGGWIDATSKETDQRFAVRLGAMVGQALTPRNLNMACRLE